MNEKRIKKAGIVLFLAMLFIPLLLTDRRTDAASEIEQRKLAEFPRLRDEEGNRNKDFISQFESWFNDHVGLRQILFEGNSRIEYELFHTSASSKVTVGKEGWLYYLEANNMNIASGQYPGLEERDLEILCRKQCLIRDYLAEQGIEYVLFLPPSKVSIYPEYIRGDFTVRETPVDLVADYLEAHSDLKVVRMKEDLLRAKEASPELLYYKTDTHWNAHGIYTAYQTLARKLKEWELIDSDPVEAELIRGDKMGDLSRMLVTDEKTYAENTWLACRAKHPEAVQMEQGEVWEQLQEYSQKYSLGEGYYYVNQNTELPVFLLFTDSMFRGYMKNLLAENCSVLANAGDHEIRQELIDLIHPDVVFAEIAERELNLLGDYSLDLIRTSVVTDEKAHTMTVKYYDFGEYPSMRFAVWNEKGDQDDMQWYEAQRAENDLCWTVTVDLKNHQDAGTINIHYYKYDSAEDPGANLKMEQIRTGE